MIHRLRSIVIRIVCLGLLAPVLSYPALAQTDATLPLFAEQAALPIRIEGPITTLAKVRSDTEYMDAKLSYADDGGTSHVFDVRFRARGNFRRQKENCWFPPVRLNFKKSETDGTLFEGQDKIKLVTHCHPTSDKHEQNVVKEYLAYKLLQAHTPYHFQVRLLKITWVDTDKKNKESEKYGFMIEADEQVAERLGLTVAEFNKTSHDQLDRKQASLVSVFEYLIGNTDYSLIMGPPETECCHNAILMRSGNSPYIPIPYDFDFSGMVDAPYAEPGSELKIRNVKTRLYRGHCTVTPEIQDTLALFREKQAAVMELIRTQEGLDDKTRATVADYIGEFYDDISNAKLIQDEFSRECS